jgi:hypothetical protein
LRYDRSMRALLVIVALLGGATGAAAAEPASLVKARMLYNAGNYEGAIDAAAVARRQAQSADAASLVIARAHLERYRQRAEPGDLAAAREALGAVHAASLSPRDHVDLLVGMGLSLYLGEIYGAAAELFDTALSSGSMLDDNDRLQLLDWWATALDREAQTRSLDRRPAVFERIGDRMEEELRRDPGNPAANYWLAAAARGSGDVDRAWDAAVAAWVRSSLAPMSAEMLRTDLDRLVTQALIPERARIRPQREQADALIAFKAEWDLVKMQWK